MRVSEDVSYWESVHTSVQPLTVGRQKTKHACVDRVTPNLATHGWVIAYAGRVDTNAEHMVDARQKRTTRASGASDDATHTSSQDTRGLTETSTAVSVDVRGGSVSFTNILR